MAKPTGRLPLATILADRPVLLPFARPWGCSWWIGLFATTAALGSMGSGFLAAVVVSGLVVWRWLQRQITARSAWPTLVAMAGLIAVGDLTRVEVYYHAHLKAKTAHDFIFSLLRSLEWPLRDHDWAGAVLWLPFLTAAAYILCNRAARRSRAGQTIVALGGWVLVQLLATAYARGAGADYPASRYMDTLIFGTAVNALALGWLLSRRARNENAVSPVEPDVPIGHHAGVERAAERPSRGEAETSPIGTSGSTLRVASLRVAGWSIGIVWAITLIIGLRALLMRNVYAELPDTKKYYLYTENHLRGFLATGDPAELTDPIPYPSAAALMERLGHRSLRTLMPASVRPALPVTAATRDDSAFTPNRATQRLLDSASHAGFPPDLLPLASRPTWGSFTAQGAAATGEWRSAPLIAPLKGWLRFETAGDLGRVGAALELRDAATDKIVGRVQPSKIPNRTWRSAYVRAPKQPFVIVARDTDAQRWFAFSAPVEMSVLSYWTWQAVKNGFLLAEIAAAVAAIVALSVVFQRRGTSCSRAALAEGRDAYATSNV